MGNLFKPKYIPINMVPKNVHAWEIKGYAIIKKQLRDDIRKGLKEKYGSLNKAEIALNISDYYHRKLHETFTRKDILFRLIKESKTGRHESEKYITKWKDTIPQESYKINFPVKPNILHTRIISHLIGDGTIGSNYTWCQKDVAPLEILIRKLLGKNLRRRNQVVTIPRIIIKIMVQALDLKLDNLTKEELCEKIAYLPKNHKIQLLTAIIEDEGTCDINRIRIRMNNERIMNVIKQVIDSLNYSRSNLTKRWYKKDGVKKDLWDISLNVKGIKKYWKDLKKIEDIYGKSLGLWKKREKVKKLSKQKANIDGWIRNKSLRRKILKSGRFKNVSFDSIKREFLLTDNETMSILRYMVNKKDLKKIKQGVYKKNEIAEANLPLLSIL